MLPRIIVNSPFVSLLNKSFVLALSASVLFASGYAQENPPVVPDTGEVPTQGSDVADKPTEAKKATKAEAPDDGKKPENIEEKPSEPSDQPATGGVAEEEAKPEGEAGAKRAKPVNSETIRVFGWVEWCEIGEKKLRMKARLDTGAKTSSLHAEDVELFERDGAKWVKFTTLTHDEKSVVIERPLKRIARIRKAGLEELDERYVVELNLAIDGIQRRGEFTLSERDHMNYPVLVGRNLLVEFGLVDPRRSHIADENIEL